MNKFNIEGRVIRWWRLDDRVFEELSEPILSEVWESFTELINDLADFGKPEAFGEYISEIARLYSVKPRPWEDDFKILIRETVCDILAKLPREERRDKISEILTTGMLFT